MSEDTIDWFSDHGTGGVYAKILVVDDDKGPTATELARILARRLNQKRTRSEDIEYFVQGDYGR